VSQALAAKGDVKLGAIRVDAKLGTPSAEVTITNHSSKTSNYIVDLSITSTDGKTQIDAAMVSAQGLAPGQTTTRSAHFKTTQKLPAGATLTIVGVARLKA
jgi:5-hydroxyisourate hydrolase-like protein (transthyretin family)